MKDNKELIAIVKKMEFEEHSSRFLLWNNEHWNKYKSIESNNQKECCSIYQTDPDPLDERTKYLWVCINAPVRKLLYIVKADKGIKKMPENRDCDCYQDAKKFNEGKEKTYRSKKNCKYAHRLELLYKFKNPPTFQQLKSYVNRETGKPWRPSQSGIKKLPRVSIFTELVKDIIAEKIY